MWLTVPRDFKDVLWEAPLEPESNEVTERWKQGLSIRGDKSAPQILKSGLPLVSIGKPEAWGLLEVYPRKKMPRPLLKKLEEADFYLVRLPCSFRPRHKEIAIEWARYTLYLHAIREEPLIAFDLHPLMVTKEVKRNVKVTLNPALKFQELEASAGEIAFGIEYTELQPIISAAGAGESEPSWDYTEFKGTFIQGSKFMHLILKAPKGAYPLHATADVVATLRAYGSLLNVVIGLDEKTAQDRLNMVLIE